MVMEHWDDYVNRAGDKDTIIRGRDVAAFERDPATRIGEDESFILSDIRKKGGHNQSEYVRNSMISNLKRNTKSEAK